MSGGEGVPPGPRSDLVRQDLNKTVYRRYASCSHAGGLSCTQTMCGWAVRSDGVCGSIFALSSVCLSLSYNPGVLTWSGNQPVKFVFFQSNQRYSKSPFPLKINLIFYTLTFYGASYYSYIGNPNLRSAVICESAIRFLHVCQTTHQHGNFV